MNRRLKYLQSVFVLEAVGHQLPLAHLVEPVELPARVLASVESREPEQVRVIDPAQSDRLEGASPVDASLQLGGEAEHAGLLERPAAARQDLNRKVDVERISRVAEMLLEIFI